MSSIIFAIFSDFERKILMTLRERIKMLCKQNGISLNKLEVECDFAKGYLSKLDKSTPNMAYLQKIANYLDVTTDYLLTGKEKEVSLPDQADLWKAIRHDTELLNALEKYMKLSEENKKRVLERIDTLSEV